MDDKAKIILDHYRNLIESRQFDEYDILGFLIFIREYIPNEYKYIRDFCDLIAHRKRNRGIAISCIAGAIENCYETYPGSKAVKGYHGIYEQDWEREWHRLGVEQDIRINRQILKELTLCIYSLAQDTYYEDKEGHRGYIRLKQCENGEIALLTTEGKFDSVYICFAKYGGYTFKTVFTAGMIDLPVETHRENGVLELRINNDCVVEG